MRKSLERIKFERYHKRLNAKVKPRVYGIDVDKKRPRKIKICSTAYMCLFFIIFFGIIAAGIALEIKKQNHKSSQSVPENNSTLSNSSSENT